MQKLITLLSIIFLGVQGKAQFGSKTYYKYDGVDGWTKCIESNWYTVDQKGDTTFYNQLSEENNQDDPNVKPKYEFNGAGNIVKPELPKPVDKVQYVSAGFVIPAKETTTTEVTVSDSMWVTDGREGSIKYIKGKDRIKWLTKNKYRDRYKYRPTPKPKKVKPKPVETINIITYKKNLYLIVSISGTVTAIDASTRSQAIKRFKKITSSPILSVTQFSDYSIIN